MWQRQYRYVQARPKSLYSTRTGRLRTWEPARAMAARRSQVAGASRAEGSGSCASSSASNSRMHWLVTAMMTFEPDSHAARGTSGAKLDLTMTRAHEFACEPSHAAAYLRIPPARRRGRQHVDSAPLKRRGLAQVHGPSTSVGDAAWAAPTRSARPARHHGDPPANRW